MALQLSIRTWTGGLVALNPTDGATKLEIFKALALYEIEEVVPRGCQVVILHQNRPLLGDFTLAEHDLQDGDTLTFQLAPLPLFEHEEGVGASEQAVQNDVTFIRDQLLSFPQEVLLLRKTNPPLASAFLTGDFEKFSKLVKEILSEVEKKRDAKLEQILRQNGDWESPTPSTTFQLSTLDLNANVLVSPSPGENQEEIPRKSHVGELTQVEREPKVFVNVKVNGIAVKACVDPGAKLTRMSKSCATRTKILSLLESNSSGKTYAMLAMKLPPKEKDLGKIRNFSIEIAGKLLKSTFTVVEVLKSELILGQDFLQSHECVIDLRRNVMKIGSNGEETPFTMESPPKP